MTLRAALAAIRKAGITLPATILHATVPSLHFQYVLTSSQIRRLNTQDPWGQKSSLPASSNHVLPNSFYSLPLSPSKYWYQKLFSVMDGKPGLCLQNFSGISPFFLPKTQSSLKGIAANSVCKQEYRFISKGCRQPTGAGNKGTSRSHRISYSNLSRSSEIGPQYPPSQTFHGYRNPQITKLVVGPLDTTRSNCDPGPYST